MTGTRLASRIQVPHLLHTAQAVSTLLVISAAGMWPARAGAAATVEAPRPGRSRK